MIHVWNAFKVIGLYVLNAIAVLGYVLISFIKNLSKTTFWHRMLGHISKKELIELSKIRLLSRYKSEKLNFCDDFIYG